MNGKRKNRLCILFSHRNNYVFKCVIIILNAWRWSLWKISTVDPWTTQRSAQSKIHLSLQSALHKLGSSVSAVPLYQGFCILRFNQRGSCRTVLLFTIEKNQQLSGSTQFKLMLFKGQLYIVFPRNHYIR